MRTIYLILLLLFTTGLSQGQSTQRVWNYHLSNIRSFSVVRGEGKIYFLSEGGIFYYNLEDNSVKSISKIDGLSGSDVKGIEYSFKTKSLIVFYENSMIDIVSDNGVVKILSDIQRKNIPGNKMIYNATCHEDFCYLSCGFGIVVLDLVKLEIKDSFIIGDNGDYMIVYDVAVDNENIYAGTPNGIKYAPLNTPNLLDYANWNYIEHPTIEKYSFNQLEYGAGRLWAVHQSDSWHSDRTISRHNASTWYYEHGNISVIKSLTTNGDHLVFSGANNTEKNTVYVYQNGVGPVHQIIAYPFMQDNMEIDPRSAIIDDEGTVWIADYNYGAIRYKNNTFDQITPVGPIDNGAFSLAYSNNKLWVAAGGRQLNWDPIYKEAIIQGYSAGKWEYFNRNTHAELKGHRDVIQVLPYPGNPNRILAATWGGGILEFDNGNLVKQFNESNSTLKSILAGYYLRIGGMDFDNQGNLWVTNSEVQNTLHMKKPDDTWKSFQLPEIAFNYKIGKVLVTSKDQVWIVVPRDVTNGLYVLSTDGTKRKHLNVTSHFTNGDEELFVKMNNVFDVVEDNKGRIWVATANGIAVYEYPDRIFTEDPFYARQPGVDRKDGIYHPLLAQATVTAIAVDGGNRKWCGTRSSGLFLISEDGTEEIENYTADNSQLISNGIISLEYDGDNGVMYVGTEMGLVSFKTDSKNAYAQFTNVYAYPNPVRSNYKGNIYITGMMENTNVKITNISGRLVYETSSNGGQAVWDGKDLAGNPVHTGVYLVFCASEDGQESTVTKIAFIR